MQYHNKAGFILLVWSKEGEKKKSKVGKHFPYGRVPQRLRIQVRGPPVRPCTPHNLHSQAKTIKTAPTAAPFPAIEHSDRSRVCKQKVGKRKSNWQNHNFFSKSEWFFWLMGGARNELKRFSTSGELSLKSHPAPKKNAN